MSPRPADHQVTKYELKITNNGNTNIVIATSKKFETKRAPRFGCYARAARHARAPAQPDRARSRGEYHRRTGAESSLS